MKKAILKDIPKPAIGIIIGGFLIIGLSFQLFLELSEKLVENGTFYIDTFMKNIVEGIQSPWMTSIFRVITSAGAVKWMTIASILLFVYIVLFSKRSNWVAIYLAISMLGISLLTTLLKYGFGRTRPSVLEQYDGTGFSFPSGHTTGSVVFYGFMMYIIFRSNSTTSVKRIICGLLTFIILSVAFSRVYLGVHYFTDILAGLSLGMAWLLVCIFALEFTLWRKKRKQV
ncbi:phosphatase PAP2 family protein [Pontibacillus litoralis]|uniref:Phosphatidic acid phosphatase type 2/haloperoxidase domain-containing protein n=1 Tax=Pontibacillus litoralis JSM 072002 TaxID=1385512 RepID=A0A0A5G6Y4_9BACI|nr:phosphatase PAP2 family protein [Pontibacillus litoralis]KGX86865.1 hypothetical protein N784_03150 [Pontibacillus litoralis JSM 072002]